MKIYFGGPIITMDEENKFPEAVVVEDGLIKFVGDKESAVKTYSNAECVDLEGRTLMPGFIDGHSHMIPTSQVTSMPDLSPAPIGDVKSIEDIKVKLKNMIETYNIPAGGIIMAKGYDETLLTDGRGLTRHDLDDVSKDHKLYVLHCSLHTAVVNTKVLEVLDINEKTKDPVGGKYIRESNGYPNGVLEENAHIQASAKLMPAPKPEDLAKMFIDGQELYASYGITTVQDGGLNAPYISLMKGMSEAGLLKLDVVGYHLVTSKEEVENAMTFSDNFGTYKNRFKMGGIKVLLDGSPQAKTAWLSKPYHIPPKGEEKDYAGYPTIPDDEVCIGIFESVLNHKTQVLVHTNGDQASEQYIRCYEEAMKRTSVDQDLRPVMVHAQTVREDQLDRMEKIAMMPSFFCMHTYFWGDLHLNSSLGEERAHCISPTMSAIERNMPFTIHSDSPVLPPDTLLNVWTAVNRQTREGVILGEDQRLSVYDALKAVTIHGAYQYCEEDSKGSISIGKKGDLVILDQNPLEVDANALKDILVLETIKDGQTIFSR